MHKFATMVRHNFQSLTLVLITWLVMPAWVLGQPVWKFSKPKNQYSLIHNVVEVENHVIIEESPGGDYFKGALLIVHDSKGKEVHKIKAGDLAESSDFKYKGLFQLNSKAYLVFSTWNKATMSHLVHLGEFDPIAGAMDGDLRRVGEFLGDHTLNWLNVIYAPDRNTVALVGGFKGRWLNNTMRQITPQDMLKDIKFPRHGVSSQIIVLDANASPVWESRNQVQYSEELGQIGQVLFDGEAVYMLQRRINSYKSSSNTYKYLLRDPESYPITVHRISANEHKQYAVKLDTGALPAGSQLSFFNNDLLLAMPTQVENNVASIRFFQLNRKDLTLVKEHQVQVDQELPTIPGKKKEKIMFFHFMIHDMFVFDDGIYMALEQTRVTSRYSNNGAIDKTHAGPTIIVRVQQDFRTVQSHVVSKFLYDEGLGPVLVGHFYQDDHGVHLVQIEPSNSSNAVVKANVGAIAAYRYTFASEEPVKVAVADGSTQALQVYPVHTFRQESGRVYFTGRSKKNGLAYGVIE